ncbi:hypothetical protein PtA15_3A669 [Puccinia triticina]|uniref:DH domain-containing protein n=1 Tax=Puccinia triticina TaxID=208348 RepID=A0ABY7CHK0_9BASI|nr:uncharacterized protein PtA15_3A669 [Puccinia triticina]WAQ83300.1 hypothetical protein PtA15_3A669 [Puccinia triticina]WAR54150.1 hypothetical protein PtB15_3B662 [Puccinia triticina]
MIIHQPTLSRPTSPSNTANPQPPRSLSSASLGPHSAQQPPHPSHHYPSSPNCNSSPSNSASNSPLLSPNRLPASMSLAPFTPAPPSKPTSSVSSPTSANPTYRALRPRRSAASLRSIPEHRGKEVDQPPLPVPATPWIEPATPGFLNTLGEPHSCSSSPASTEPPDSTPHGTQYSPSVDPAHLQPQQPSSPYQTRIDEQFATGPHTVPGPRDQRSLSRYRLASQPLSSRHSEGSQYASSSNWTPSSTTGSRIGFDSTANGMRSSIASRDSRFTAETDYDDYCHPKPIVLQQASQNVPGAHSHPLNLSVSASWHSGDQPNHKPSGLGPTAPIKSGPTKTAPTLLSLINLDQTPRSANDMVGLGITSDETISVTRGSRSPSLTGPIDLPRAGVNHQANTKTSRMARSASSSVSNGTSINPSPFNPMYAQQQNALNLNLRPSRVLTPLGDRSTPSKTAYPDTGESPNVRPGNLYIPPNSLGQAGLPYDNSNPSSSASSRNTPSNGHPSTMGAKPRRNPAASTPEPASDQRENFTTRGHYAEGSTESKHRFYQHQSHWDDFDDQSPCMHSSSQIPSQAVALVEDGRGCIVDISSSKSPLEKLAVPEDTTHLLLAKTFAPFLVGALLASKLPIIAANLVVLDISDAGLTSLPSAIACCEVLEELNVSGNVMANGELPVFLCNLTALKVLAADRCGLYQIAYPYGGLTNLRDLSVRYNHLRSLPSWLCLLPRLEILLVDGNEFEPPWQELVEPLLSSSLYARAEPQLLPLDPTDSRHFAPSYPSPVTSSVGSTLRSLPESSHNVRTSPDDHRRNASAERPHRGRRHLAGSESTWVTSASSLASDHPDENGERPQSVCSAEGSNHLNSPRSSYLRRLRSTNDMSAGSASRPLSAHEAIGHSTASLIDLNPSNMSRDDVADGFRPPASFKGHPRRPSSSSIMQQGNLASPLEYTDGSNQLAPPRHDPKALPAGEASQLTSSNAAQQTREHQKKSFGFLKKMSLGKLRRDPARPRTASTASYSLYARSSGNPSAEAHYSDPSKLMSPDGSTPQESDEHPPGDRSSKSSADETQSGLKLGDSHSAPKSAKKRLNNRRSFLKLEDHFVPPRSPSSIALPGVIPEQEDPSKSQSPKVEHASSAGKPSEQSGTRDPNSATTVASFQPPPSATNRWTALRSIMMYLRDVHDLSGDFARIPGGFVAGGARPMLSTGVSRATSTKHSQTGSSMFTDGRSTPLVLNPHSTMDFDPEGLDNNLSTGNLTGTPSPLPTFEPVKVTENALRRFKVIEEIVATEKSYIKGLKELESIYITSAILMVSSSIGKEKEPMVPPAERKVVFNNVEAIIGFHVDVLLPDFQEVMDRLLQKQAAIASGNPKESTGGSEEKRRLEIESQLTNFAAEELARVFIRHAAFLKLYSTYITQFDTALERLREWSVTAPAPSTNAPAWAPSSMAPSSNTAANHHSTLSSGQKKRLKTYMKRCRAHSSHTQMNLESYLLMPVQRLPRYKLLLENLVSCTPDLSCVSARELEARNQSGVLTDKKLPPLTPNKVAVEALNIVSAVTAEMNERKRDSEGRQRLLYWQQRFGNKFRSPLVQPHRTLIKEGTMTLMRTVKLTTKDSVTSGGGPSHPSSRIRVPVLNTDSQPVAMIVLLCTDLLVLVKDPGDGGRASNQSPASLFQALRLAQHSRPHMSLPATIFGADQTMIRFVDNRGIFYFQCDCQRSAAAWMVAINQQVPLL